MAFDGVLTRAVVHELNSKIVNGRIDKVNQPEVDLLVLNVRTNDSSYKLLISSGSNHARVHLTDETIINPPKPYKFCMLMRKHLTGALISEIRQVGGDRIIEIIFECQDELGFRVPKMLVIEIMGKHSNAIFVDLTNDKIIDAIKHVNEKDSRYRQVFPGMRYEYPPTYDENAGIGMAPSLKRQLENMPEEDRDAYLNGILSSIEDGSFIPRIYYDNEDKPQEFSICDLDEYETSCEREDFDDLNELLETYYELKDSSNLGKQKANDLIKPISTALEKAYLKKKRLSEDLLKAENSEELKLYGELITANIHLIKPGMKEVELVNYYDGKLIKVPLDEKFSAQKNAQNYFKKYSKQRTAISEKTEQLSENQKEIDYLESVMTFLENSKDVKEIEELRAELVETGYVRRRKQQGNFKDKKFKPDPHKYTLSNGMTLLVGRNNRENDYLTFKIAKKGDLWLHTKDIPGSHCILETGGGNIDDLGDVIYEAAEVAAFHSKARASENVPVDYVPIRFVKKPAGSKPGYVIFTNNRTVYVTPKAK